MCFYVEAVLSCARIVECFNSSTTAHHDCHPYLCTTTDPPTSNYHCFTFYCDGTCRFHTPYCLPVSGEKKKSLLQSKSLCKDIRSHCFDYCNSGTNYCTTYHIRGDFVGATTDWNWSYRTSVVATPIPSPTCTWVVLDEKMSEDCDECTKTRAPE